MNHCIPTCKQLQSPIVNLYRKESLVKDGQPNAEPNHNELLWDPIEEFLTSLQQGRNAGQGIHFGINPTKNLEEPLIPRRIGSNLSFWFGQNATTLDLDYQR